MATPAEDRALAERRRRRLWQLGATVVVSAAVVIIAIAISRAGDDNPGTTTGPPEGVAEVRALYRGIPQNGIELGPAGAPVTLTEFADLQCPFCSEYAREVLPELVRRYVRTGKVKMVFRALTFIGDDSERAARAAAAAGAALRLWPFVDLVFRNQGGENDGWVTDDYLRRIAVAAQVDPDDVFVGRDDADVTRQLDEAKDEAERFEIGSTPSFLIGRRGAAPMRFEPDELSVDDFVQALDEAIAGG